VHRSLTPRERPSRRASPSRSSTRARCRPLDEDTLVGSVKKTNRAVVAHEAVTRMGHGAEITAVLQYKAFDWLDAPIERVGSKFAPLAFAPVMESFVIPHASDVLDAVLRTVGKNP
jgi:pyruvate dehydrogenase E1 component beta subunit